MQSYPMITPDGEAAIHLLHLCHPDRDEHVPACRADLAVIVRAVRSDVGRRSAKRIVDAAHGLGHYPLRPCRGYSWRRGRYCRAI